MYINRKLEVEGGAGIEADTPVMWDVGALTGILTTSLNAFLVLILNVQSSDNSTTTLRRQP